MRLVIPVLIALSGTATATERCFQLDDLRAAYEAVLPDSEVEAALSGVEAQSYLEKYNSFGQHTEYSGDVLVVIRLRRVRVVLVARDGVVCQRFFVGPALHRRIVVQMKREEV